MLFLKRAITATVLFVLLTIILLTGTFVAVAAVVGARAAAEQHVTEVAAAKAVGREAGENFGRQYGFFILVGSVGVAGVLSCALSFGGAFPWCRLMALPPPAMASVPPPLA